MKKWITFMLILLTVTLAACGGDDSSNGDTDVSADSGEKVTLEASNFEFDKEEYHVASGDVAIELVNKEGMHGITIDGVDGFELQGEGTKTVSLDPGEYTIRCSIPCGQGHADMMTTLVVE